MAVDSSCRGQGIGTKLMEQAEKEAIRRSIKLLRVDTNKLNVTMQTLLPILGYVFAGEISLKYDRGSATAGPDWVNEVEDWIPAPHGVEKLIQQDEGVGRAMKGLNQTAHGLALHEDETSLLSVGFSLKRLLMSMRAISLTGKHSQGQYRQGRAKFVPEDYVPGLCTHILFAFAYMDDNYTAIVSDEADLPTSWAGAGMYARVNALKKNDTQLKTLLSFGGYSFGTRLFKEMTSTAQNRQTFINSSIGFLLKELRKAVVAESRDSSNKTLLITAAVTANTETADNGFDIPTVGKLFDYIFLMSYDFHGSWEQVTGFNAPLYRRDTDTGASIKFNVADAAKHWAKQGMPKSKIIVGMATYGRGWTLDSTTSTGVGAAASAPSRATPFVASEGVGAFYEFCEMWANGSNATSTTKHKCPTWSMETSGSAMMTRKALRLSQNGSRTINMECSNGNGVRYPLIGTIAKELGGKKSLINSFLPKWMTVASKK
uniref:Chitinase n=1 Tax=Ditylenchus dipsaci TaxID=166011 RepID=A0A915CTS9_9BILA